jgi:hypothetical protein
MLGRDGHEDLSGAQDVVAAFIDSAEWQRSAHLLLLLVVVVVALRDPRVSRTWQSRHHSAITREIPPLFLLTV